MNCTELDQFLHPFLDGEFEPVERLEVEQHLASCEACRGRVEDEARFLQALRSKAREASGVAAPASLRRAIAGRIHTEHRRAQALAWLRWGAAALVAAAASGAYLYVRPSARDAFLEDAASRHARRLPFEVQAASAGDLEAWFDGKLAYRVAVPKLWHATPAGARLANVRDHEAAYIGYTAAFSGDMPPRRVGVFAFDDSADEVPVARSPSLEVQQVRGFRVAAWRSAGIVYELVTDLDEGDIRRLLNPGPDEAGGGYPGVPAGLDAPPRPPRLELLPAALQH